ncbi:MAG: 6-phosphofructokinase [Eubacteriales bacterium]
MEKKYNAVVGQSGGPTCAINATLAGVIAGCLQNADAVGKVYGMRNGIEGFMKESLVELNGRFSDPAQIDLLCMTPASALGSCRMKLKDEAQFERIFALLEKYEIKYFFYIGGNDSMDAVAKLEKSRREHPEWNPLETRFIGVPKTIDNDLCLTDHTPGFGSAAKFIACSLEEIARDCAVYLQKAVTVVEIMGRDAGWLAASAALTAEIAGIGADLIYLPETPFDVNAFLSDVMHMLNVPGKNFVLVAVSEGIRDKNGEYVARAAMSGVMDNFGHAYLSGTGKYLENLVRDEVGCKCRSVELSVLQRCASHLASKTDIDESFAVGRAAVTAALDGKSGRMMAFERLDGKDYGVKITDVDVMQSANRVKTLPPEFIAPNGKHVTQACIDYLLPLIQGECAQPYVGGIPKHFVL